MPVQKGAGQSGATLTHAEGVHQGSSASSGGDFLGGQLEGVEAKPRVIMIDTTVWIDYFRGIRSPEHRALEHLIQEGRMICVTDIIQTEALQGIRSDEQYIKTRHFLQRLPCLTAKAPATFLHAAELYRLCRKRGGTIRSTVDCLIAAVCLEARTPLLHHDADFDQLAKHCGLRKANPVDILS